MKKHNIGLLGTILLPTLSALGIALCSLGLFIYFLFYSQLYAGMDAVLKSKAEGLIESIDLFWNLEGKDRNAYAEFVSFAQTWVTEKSPDSILLNSIVQISDISGAIIATSRNVNFRPENPINPGAIVTVKTVFTDGQTMLLRVYAQDVPEKNRPGYRILVGQPIATIESAIYNLKTALLLIIPAVLVFLALTIVFIVRRALRPLENIIDSMGRIGVKNLNERVSINSGMREISALGKSFDTMLERLDNAFTEQRTFIADLSHQIKTPLSIVKGQLETTLRHERSQEEYAEVLESGLEEIDTITRIIEKLLLLARYDSREIKPEFRKLDLADEVRNLVDDFALLARSRGLGVKMSLSPGAWIQADQNMLRQIFINLFDNAVKYANPETDIQISVSVSDKGASLSVLDFGICIDPSNIPNLFGRFQRFDTAGVQGFGLGLSIVETITLQHGATIDVKSSVSDGTAFTVTFPINDT